MIASTCTSAKRRQEINSIEQSTGSKKICQSFDCSSPSGENITHMLNLQMEIAESNSPCENIIDGRSSDKWLPCSSDIVKSNDTTKPINRNQIENMSISPPRQSLIYISACQIHKESDQQHYNHCFSQAPRGLERSLPWSVLQYQEYKTGRICCPDKDDVNRNRYEQCYIYCVCGSSKEQ